MSALREVAAAARAVMDLEYPCGGYESHPASGARGAEKWARLDEALAKVTGHRDDCQAVYVDGEETTRCSCGESMKRPSPEHAFIDVDVLDDLVRQLADSTAAWGKVSMELQETEARLWECQRLLAEARLEPGDELPDGLP